MMEVSEICARLNDRAAQLAPELLPNGYRSGNYWMASGIADTGRGASLYVYLSGPNVGHWRDEGNCAAGEEHGDMLDLVMLKQTGGDKAAALAWAKSLLGIQDDYRPGRKTNERSAEERARAAEEARLRAEKRDRELAEERARKAKKARWRFLQGQAIAGTPAELYLRGRQIEPGASGEWPGSLRYHGALHHKESERDLPAMLGAIYDADGTHIGTHRTYLELVPGRGWGKLGAENAKMVLGNMGGGFVPINKGASDKSMRDMPAGEPVYVTEGIEDALCVRMVKPEARIVAAISLGNIGAIVLPARVSELVVVADRDDNPKAIDTLERSIARQQARGMKVRLVMPPLEVNGQRVKDINDWLRALAAAPAKRERRA